MVKILLDQAVQPSVGNVIVLIFRALTGALQSRGNAGVLINYETRYKHIGKREKGRTGITK